MPIKEEDGYVMVVNILSVYISGYLGNEQQQALI